MMFMRRCYKLFCCTLLIGIFFIRPSFAEDPAFAVPTPPASLNVAFAAAFTPEADTVLYEDLLNYLEDKTGISMQLISGLSYSTVNTMLEQGAVHMAFVCGYPYVLFQETVQNPSLKLLTAPIMVSPIYEGKPQYYSYIITHKDHPAARFEDLKGSSFVYSDATSNAGYNMPRAKLIAMGETDGFFSKALQSGSHEESIRMVAERQADASAVDSLVLDYARSTAEPYAQQVKIIDKLGPSTIPPLVYSTLIPDDTAEKIRHALLEMHTDPKGKAWLKRALIARFSSITDKDYDDIRTMHRLAGKHRYMQIK